MMPPTWRLLVPLLGCVVALGALASVRLPPWSPTWVTWWWGEVEEVEVVVVVVVVVVVEAALALRRP
jgi:hypothetical protein